LSELDFELCGPMRYRRQVSTALENWTVSAFEE